MAWRQPARLCAKPLRHCAIWRSGLAQRKSLAGLTFSGLAPMRQGFGRPTRAPYSLRLRRGPGCPTGSLTPARRVGLEEGRGHGDLTGLRFDSGGAFVEPGVRAVISP